MNVYEAIAARRTIRDFAPGPVEFDVLRRILAAGLKAPSHNHLREWHFVIIQDAGVRGKLVSFFNCGRTEDELRELLDGWGMTDERQYAMYFDAVPKQTAMVLAAGALVVPCFRQRGNLLGAKKSLHELNAFASIWAVLQNVLVWAASEGIQGVTKIISEPEETDHIRAVLEVPVEYEIPCYLALGHPAEDAYEAEQLEISLEDCIHFDRWVD